MICAFHALCIVSLVAVYLDLNLNLNFMFKLKSNCFVFLSFPSLFSPLGLAQPAISSPLPFLLSPPLAARPLASLPLSLLPCTRPTSRRPARQPRAPLLFPSPPFPFFFLGRPRVPGPNCPRLLPPSLPLALTGGTRLSGFPFPAPDLDSGPSLARPREIPAASTVSASGPHAQAPPRPPYKCRPNPSPLFPKPLPPAPLNPSLRAHRRRHCRPRLGSSPHRRFPCSPPSHDHRRGTVSW
jgi:hypothetical protein